MRRIIPLILLVPAFLVPVSPLNSEDVSKHFLDAKLAYINSDFETALNECNNAIQQNEVSFDEAQAFLDLVRFIRNFSTEKLKDARALFEAGEYMSCLAVLSDILKKDSGNAEVKRLYRETLARMKEEEKKQVLDRVNREIEMNRRSGNDTILIALYTEKLLINENDEETKIELKRVKMKYNSRQIKLEVDKMIKNLEELISQSDFDLEKAVLIVNNILYIDPPNRKGQRLKGILEDYRREQEKRKKEMEEAEMKKKQEEAVRSRIAETIEVKLKSRPVDVKKKKTVTVRTAARTNLPVQKTNVLTAAVTNREALPVPVLARITNMEKQVVKAEVVKQKEEENRAQIHFSRGVNRFNSRLFKEAKEEFILAGRFDASLKRPADQYVKKCEENEKAVDLKVKREINRNIEESRVLEKREQVEKAINVLYTKMVKNNMTTLEGEQYLKRIIAKNVIDNRLSVNPFSPLYPVLNYLKEAGFSAFNRREFGLSVHFWRLILEFFPENSMALDYFQKCLGRMKDGRDYLKKMYEQGVACYNSGDLYKSSFYFGLIIRSGAYTGPGKDFKNIEALNRKCLEHIKKISKSEEQIFQVYNSAMLDFMNGSYSSAVVKWEYILKQDPGHVKSRFNLNKVNNILNNREKKMTAGHLSPRELSKLNQCYYNGIMEYNKENYTEALSWFREVLRLYPEHQKAINNIGKINRILSSKKNEK